MMLPKRVKIRTGKYTCSQCGKQNHYNHCETEGCEELNSTGQCMTMVCDSIKESCEKLKKFKERL